MATKHSASNIIKDVKAEINLVALDCPVKKMMVLFWKYPVIPTASVNLIQQFQLVLTHDRGVEKRGHSFDPSRALSSVPNLKPSSIPSVVLSSIPSGNPSGNPSAYPSVEPSNLHSSDPSSLPSFVPSMCSLKTIKVQYILNYHFIIIINNSTFMYRCYLHIIQYIFASASQ
jgi:hypothetical protein